MNGSLATNAALLDELLPALTGINDVRIVLCPSFPYLSQLSERLVDTGIGLGAQTLSQFPAGAYTGEVSATMLTDLGCHYVLVGHSERRQLFGERDADTAQKFAAAKSAGLVPVLCVGETLAERQAGQTEAVVAHQVQTVIDTLGIEALRDSVIAYEPVWAIGTGETATPGQAQAVHAFIRGLVAEQCAEIAKTLPLLYGGSVKADNAAELFAQPDVDGGLVGGASLDARAFIRICATLSGHSRSLA
ncbi:triosephosphate isomerase [Marinobacterium nitratireducens]|uniref:Triosephosphate isomerase n=2 Tax=Marinobacterium nitratireducens TaxID=518897 RepID=A0A917ZJN4_9GAMM|nr:triosephosphate isomerase [Marinobacterium nitratireducens]